MTKKSIVIAGSNGLIGKEVVNQLILHPAYDEIILLVRKSSSMRHPKVREILFDFSRESFELKDFKAQKLFICIGTTMKKAKTKENFKEVDLKIPVKLGRLAKKSNIEEVSVISAMGANPSSIFFYNKVKGEMEIELMSLNLPKLTILRPSLLLGEREEFRFGERVADKLYKAAPFLYPEKYRPIHASDVAKVMVHANHAEKDGLPSIIENSMLHRLSRKS
jgi:uncharacterized protein YbjT (DUF2867 family)